MNINNNTNKTKMLTLTALFAAVLAAASWISIPIPITPIPANLGTLAVTLSGALLGRKYGPLSVLIYILLGAVGIPVFAGFTGGLGHIAGPTGGYIAGYIATSFISGILIEKFYGTDDPGSSKTLSHGNTHSGSDSIRHCIVVAAAAILGIAACYAIGTIWFMHLTGNTLATSVAMCVLPFIPGDAFKTAAAVVLVPPLKKTLSRLQ